MFNHSQRMNSREFLSIYIKGKKHFSPFFRIILGGNIFRVAVVIPKKKLKKRIQRNKEKRRITHALKKIFNNTYPPIGIILFIQKDTTTLSFRELVLELKQILKKTDM